MRKFKNFFSLFIITLCILSGLRGILFLAYPADFSALTHWEIIQSFLMGVRVDIIATSLAFALPALLYFLPFPFIQRKWVQVSIFSLLFLSISLIIMIVCGDLLYFNHVHRHVAKEMAAVGNDVGILLETAKAHWALLFAFLAFEFFLFALFKKLLNFNVNSAFNLKNIGLFILVVALLALGVRNKFVGKPFGVSDAFTSNKSASGNLALNGVFSMLKSLKNQPKLHFMPNEEAQKLVQEQLQSRTFRFVDKKYPLLRQLDVPAKLTTQPNVVIILLESWSAKYIDSFSGNHFGVTKNFDRIARNGLKFDNFYANGQRSIEGISALFTGLPVLPYSAYLGHGLELSHLSYLGNVAKKAGYATLAMQSSKRSSFRVDSIATLAGFNEYYGAEDIPDLHWEESAQKPTFGAWDNNMLQFYLQKINQLQAPFFAFTFTASTHSPFVSPGKKWEKYPHQEDHIFGYLNTLNYADEAIGRFMAEAEKQPWFDNTIFVFLADHALGLADDHSLQKAGLKVEADRPLENMRIPLVIYAPKIFTPQVIERLGSQADLFPTLAHLLGWKTPIATTSNSLFAQHDKPFVLFANGDLLGFIRPQGYIKHNLNKTLENNLSPQAVQTALAFYQLLGQLQEENRIAPAYQQN